MTKIHTVSVDFIPPTFEEYFTIFYNPTEADVKHWLMTNYDKDYGILVILDNTPKKDLGVIQDYGFLEELTIEEGMKILQPFWSDCEETLEDYLEFMRKDLEGIPSPNWGKL